MTQPAVLPQPEHDELRVPGLVGQHPVRALLGKDDADRGRTRRPELGNLLAEQPHVPAGPHHHEGSTAGLARRAANRRAPRQPSEPSSPTTTGAWASALSRARASQ